jgi:hypothetical protein
MSERRPYAATDDNLKQFALEPTFRLLIAVALDGSVITYGELKKKLEEKPGFSTIFATRIGFVAGELMEKIQVLVPDAPLINVLVVNQTDRQPSRGAGSFMAKRFNEAKLAEENAKQNYPELWRKSFERASAEVYAYGIDRWQELIHKIFQTTLDQDQITKDRADRKDSTEEDGITEGRQYGPGGEGKFHRALRLWIKDNPQAVVRFAVTETETEYDLDSGDRVDVVYKCLDRTILLEVKSRQSNDSDLKRGVFQCVKYRAVRKAMDVRQKPLIQTILVTETEPPGHIKALLKVHKIGHFLAPLDR